MGVRTLPLDHLEVTRGSFGRPEALVIIAGNEAVEVERELVAGALGCPDCPGLLRPWGSARRRILRCADGGAGMTGPRGIEAAETRGESTITSANNRPLRTRKIDHQRLG